jgi:type 1 fimbriae regulatory protein FimB/type 1 fimbriae regulatory protein FimE
VDFKTATLHVRRAKNGTPATHPLTGRELRALRRHQKDSEKSPFVFVSEPGAPLSAPGFSRMIERAAVAADLGIKAHAHMLRHGCGYKLANDGIDTRALQAYLGHRNIQNTTRYTALAPDRFKGFWRD